MEQEQVTETTTETKKEPSPMEKVIIQAIAIADRFTLVIMFTTFVIILLIVGTIGYALLFTSTLDNPYVSRVVEINGEKYIGIVTHDVDNLLHQWVYTNDLLHDDKVYIFNHVDKLDALAVYEYHRREFNKNNWIPTVVKDLFTDERTRVLEFYEYQENLGNTPESSTINGNPVWWFWYMFESATN